ncbi:hypothetical protein KFL_002470110 [Klebsormidium nitens]|uniref:MYND-type domain-containing protein n=1 Tax=Klebsormidium nitens TaxID=105231 RepID=A0A1Y1I581_KLENI|nr:hypothetical protein KFL_002470110 [Klebsormidium nitens]|eukprot:GAQ85653.1 hypothetical protein KFL_002470110 [Klebsormidium nitens]
MTRAEEAVAALNKLCCSIIWNKKHPDGLTREQMQELLLKPTPALKKVQKLMKNESLVQAIVQLLHHPVLLRDATAEEAANNQDFRALASSLSCIGYFPDFASSLTEAGLAQEVANLGESFRKWTRPVLLNNMVPSSGENCLTWIRNLGRLSTCLELLSEMLAWADFGQEAVRVGLLPGLLKAWPPKGYDHPRYFNVIQANEAMCECSADMLRAVELALRNGEFREWKEKQRNELVEWLLSVLTWQRFLGFYPECTASQNYQGAVRQVWVGIYGQCLGAGSGVRSKLARKMQKAFKELVASPEARTWSPTLQSTMKVVGEVMDEHIKERDGGGGASAAVAQPPEDGLALLTSAGGAPQVRPDKVAALLRSRKKADVLRGIQAIRAVLEGATRVNGDKVALCRDLEGGLPFERAGVREAVMDAFEGPLGGWLLRANQKADAETALTSLDSMCRRFLSEVAAAEAGKLSVPAEFPQWEYWRAKEAGPGDDGALGAGSGEVRTVGGLGRTEAGIEDQFVARKREVSLSRGSNASNADCNGQKEVLGGLTGTSTLDGPARDLDGRSAGLDGPDRDQDGRNGSPDGRDFIGDKSDGVSNGRNGSSDGQSVESTRRDSVLDGLDGTPTMDSVVLRLLRWVVRQPALEPVILAAALMPIEIECARVGSARVVAARNGALALGKRVLEMELKPGPVQRLLAHRARELLDPVLRENHRCPEASAEVRRLARELGVAECAADLLGAGSDSRISELHVLNVLEACTRNGPGLRTKPGFIKRAVARLKYALSVYARANTEADDLKLEWDVSATCLDPPPVWPRVFGAVYQLLKVLADVIRDQSEPAFVEFVRSGGVEAAAVFIDLNPTRLLMCQSDDPNIWETDWGLRARKRLAEAADLADGLWERAEAKYGLRRCGRVKNAFQRCHQRETKGGTFKQCGRKCGVFYCSRDCQVNHWKEGHKQACTPRNGSIPAPGPTAA